MTKVGKIILAQEVKDKGKWETRWSNEGLYYLVCMEEKKEARGVWKVKFIEFDYKLEVWYNEMSMAFRIRQLVFES